MDGSGASASADLDARLARLTARRAAFGAVTRAEPGHTTLGRFGRRRHPAAATRLLVAGLSLSAFLSIIASIGASTPASGASTAAVGSGSYGPAAGPQPPTPKPATKSKPARGPKPTTATTATTPTTVFVPPPPPPPPARYGSRCH
jgi:hypothetical protein